MTAFRRDTWTPGTVRTQVEGTGAGCYPARAMPPSTVDEPHRRRLPTTCATCPPPTWRRRFGPGRCRRSRPSTRCCARIEALNPSSTPSASCTPTRPASRPAPPRPPCCAATTSARSTACRSRSRTTSPIAGKPLTYGSRLLRDNVARETSPIGARIAASGAIIVGRTNTPEYAWRGSTDNRLFGETRNPWDLDADGRRLQRRGRRGGRGRPDAALARHRRRRLDPDPGQLLRHRRAQAVVRAGAVLPLARRQRAGRARRPDDPHRPRCRALPGRAGRPGRARPLLAARQRRAVRRVGRGGRRGLARRLEPGPRPHPGRSGGAPDRRDGRPRLRRTSAPTSTQPDLGLPDPEPLLGVLYPFVQAAAHAAAPAGGARRDGPRPGGDRAAGRRGSRPSRSGRRWRLARPTGIGCGAPSSSSTSCSTPTISVPAFELGIVGPTEVDGRPVVHLGLDAGVPVQPDRPSRPSPCRAASRAGGLPVGLQIVGRRFADGAVLRAAAAFEAARPWADRQPAAVSVARVGGRGRPRSPASASAASSRGSAATSTTCRTATASTSRSSAARTRTPASLASIASAALAAPGVAGGRGRRRARAGRADPGQPLHAGPQAAGLPRAQRRGRALRRRADRGRRRDLARPGRGRRPAASRSSTSRCRPSPRPRRRSRRTRRSSTPTSATTSATAWSARGGDVDGAFARAAHVVSVRVVHHRISATPLEPRGLFARWDAGLRRADRLGLVARRPTSFATTSPWRSACRSTRSA